MMRAVRAPIDGSRSNVDHCRARVVRPREHRMRTGRRDRDVDDARVRTRDLDADQLVARGRDVDRRGVEGLAAVHRFVDHVGADAGVRGHGRDREDAPRVGGIGKKVGRDRVRERAPVPDPPARDVIRRRQADLGRQGVEEFLGRRADRVGRRHRRLGALARPLPRCAVVVRDDEAEVRRQDDPLRVIDGQQHRVRFGKRAVGRGTAWGRPIPSNARRYANLSHTPGRPIGRIDVSRDPSHATPVSPPPCAAPSPSSMTRSLPTPWTSWRSRSRARCRGIRCPVTNRCATVVSAGRTSTTSRR